MGEIKIRNAMQKVTQKNIVFLMANGWKPEYCVICGRPYPQEHHVFFGTANRKISEKYGLKIPLCAEHHTGNKGIHHNREIDLKYKRIAQKWYESYYGTRTDFIKLIGKSYL